MLLDISVFLLLLTVFICISTVFCIVKKGAWNLLLFLFLLFSFAVANVSYQNDFLVNIPFICAMILCAFGFSLVSLHSGIGLNFKHKDDFLDDIIKTGLSFLMLVMIILVPVFYFVLNFRLSDSFILALLFVPVLFLREDKTEVEHILKDLSIVLVGFVLVMIGVFVSLGASAEPLDAVIDLGKAIVLALAASVLVLVLASLHKAKKKKGSDSLVLMLISTFFVVIVSVMFKANLILSLILYAILFGNFYIRKRKVLLKKLDTVLRYSLYGLAFVVPFMINFSAFRFDLFLYGLLIYVIVLLIKFIVVFQHFRKSTIREVLVITLNHNLIISIVIVAFLVITNLNVLTGDIRGIVFNAVMISLLTSFFSNRLNEVKEVDF